MRCRPALPRTVALLVALVLTATAGCGGDDAGAGDGAGGDAAADVDALCADATDLREEGRRAGEVFAAPDVTDAGARAAVAEVVAATRAVLDGLPDRLGTDALAVASALDDVEAGLDTATVEQLRAELPETLGVLLTDPTSSEAGAGRILQYLDSVCDLPE